MDEAATQTAAPVNHRPLLEAMNAVEQDVILLRFCYRQQAAKLRSGLPAGDYAEAIDRIQRRIKPHLQTMLALCGDDAHRSFTPSTESEQT